MKNIIWIALGIIILLLILQKKAPVREVLAGNKTIRTDVPLLTQSSEWLEKRKGVLG